MKDNVRVICFGEVLWDVVDNKGLIGGAPLNVCYHLSRHDIDSRLISQVGNDQNGTELLSGIGQLGVNTDMISVSPNLPTSEVLVDLATGGKVTYTIVENVAWDAIPYSEQYVADISASACFVFGSLASRSAVSKNSLFRYLAHAKWKVMDLNLREPYYDKYIIHQLLSSCNTLKINDDEFRLISEYFDITGSDDQEILMGILAQFPGINEIIVTWGADGAQYLSSDLHLKIPAVKVGVVDTVGSGDAFLAAFLAGKLQQKSIQQCMRDAVVLSGFIAASRGACPVYKLEDVKKKFEV